MCKHGIRQSRLVLLTLVLISLLTGIASAQEYRGRVQGTISDPTKASVAGANVTLRNINTGIDTVKQTDSAGHYLIDFVLPGTYIVAVEAAGFQKSIQENVTVLTGGDVTVDLQLVIGSATESITVRAEVTQIQFNTSTMETTVQTNMLRDLPILARNPFTLALLNPAVVNEYWDVAHRLPYYMWATGGLDIGGRTAGKNDLLLDGAPTGVSAKGSYMPSMDGVQEVSVQQNAVDAEFGFSAGGTLNVSMKSGTNDFHGNASYFGRNPALNAVTDRTVFPHQVSIVKNHIWGGTVGGPVIIPKIINGRNKLFFYQTYEAWKNTVPSGNTSTAPTDLERTGDFSKSFAPDGSLRVIYDPASTQIDPATSKVTRTPFPGNVLPQERINPSGKQIVNDLWKPTNPGDDITGINNVRVSFPYQMGYWNTSTRVDYNISDKLRVFGRFSKFRTQSDHPQWDKSIALTSSNEGASLATNPALDGLWVINEHTTMNVRYSSTHVGDLYNSKWAKVSKNVWSDIWPNGWYNGLAASMKDLYYPNFNFYGNGSLGNTGRQNYYTNYLNSQNASVNLIHDQGIHHLKAGWMLRYQYDEVAVPNLPKFDFNSVDTGNSWLEYDASRSGNMYASALLGVVAGGAASYTPSLDSHQQLWAGYLQDDIKLSQRITLNLGLRYELETAPSDANRIYSRYLDLNNPIPEFSTPPQMPSEVTSLYKGSYKWNGAWMYTDDSHPGVYNAQKSVFLPRAGAAIRIDDRTSLRLGYARYSVPWVSIYPETSYWPTDGFSRTTNALGPVAGTPRASIDNPFPTSGPYANPLLAPVGKGLGRYLNLGSSVIYFPKDMVHPINDRINVSVQRQLPFQILTDTTFFTNLGRDVQDRSMWGNDYQTDLNQVDPNYSYTYKGLLDQQVPNPFYNLLPADKMPGYIRSQETVSVGSLLRTYPQYDRIQERLQRGRVNHYYSLQFKAEKPLAKGLAFTFGYNYSNEHRSEYYDEVDNYNNRFTMQDTGSPSHNVRFAGTWELPFGKGRQFLSHTNWLVDAVIGGWATSHMFMWQNGPLVNFGSTMLASGNPKIDNPTRDHYFDTSKFDFNPAYTRRTNPWYYDGLRGFGTWSWDATAVKYFPITERMKFELRMEFYNVTNSFMPSQPDTWVGSSNFGRSTGIANYGREMQFAGRFHF